MRKSRLFQDGKETKGGEAALSWRSGIDTGMEGKVAQRLWSEEVREFVGSLAPGVWCQGVLILFCWPGEPWEILDAIWMHGSE